MEVQTGNLLMFYLLSTSLLSIFCIIIIYLQVNSRLGLYPCTCRDSIILPRVKVQSNTTCDKVNRTTLKTTLFDATKLKIKVAEKNTETLVLIQFFDVKEQFR